jgi:hypothetical protein
MQRRHPKAMLGFCLSTRRWVKSIQAHVRKEGPMAEEATVTVEAVEEKKKGGFLKKLMKIAVIGAVIAAIVAFVKRRRGDDLDDVEWQELPPPAGG